MVANGYRSSFEVIGAGAWGPSAFAHVSHAGPLTPEQAIAHLLACQQEAPAAVSTSRTILSGMAGSIGSGIAGRGPAAAFSQCAKAKGYEVEQW